MKPSERHDPARPSLFELQVMICVVVGFVIVVLAGVQATFGLGASVVVAIGTATAAIVTAVFTVILRHVSSKP